MKKILTIASLVLALPSVAFSATYREANRPNESPGVALTSLGITGCVYASAPIALGDVVSHADGSKQVCASGRNGPVLMDLAAINAQEHGPKPPEGQSVNTAVDVTASIASISDGCETAGTLTLRGDNQLFVCSRADHWVPANVSAAQLR